MKLRYNLPALNPQDNNHNQIWGVEGFLIGLSIGGVIEYNPATLDFRGYLRGRNEAPSGKVAPIFYIEFELLDPTKQDEIDNTLIGYYRGRKLEPSPEATA